MNIYDGTCRGCGKPMKVLTGSPQVCKNCKEEQEKERALERMLRNSPTDLVFRMSIEALKGERIG